MGRNDPCPCGSGLKVKRCHPERLKKPIPEPTGTYWNGEKAKAEVVKVVVADDIPSGWWCKGLEGTVREAVRVEYGESRFYLDNSPHEDSPGGDGWLKVTKGRGHPRYGHRSLPIKEEVAS